MQLLIVSALRSLLLALIVAGLLAALRVVHPGVRKAAWAFVLLCSALMPVLGGRLLHIKRRPPLGTSVLTTVRTNSGNQKIELGVSNANIRVGIAKGYAVPLWTVLIRTIQIVYVLGVVLLFLRICVGFVRAARIWRHSERSKVLGFGHVHFSTLIHSPWTFCSCILLPSDAAIWPEDKLASVLAHEEMHVKHGDFYLQMSARLYTAFFWFSPLGWWLQKECADLGEQTSDHAALQQVPDPIAYAQLLVRFSVGKYPTGAITMARVSGLSNRIHLILQQGELMKRFISPLRASLLTAAVLPAALLLATASPVVQAASFDPKQLSSTEKPSSGDTPVDGFACTLDHHTSVVGLRFQSGVRVSSGVLTYDRVAAIDAKLRRSFLAFSEDGHDYVITDPALVNQALGLFASTIPSAIKTTPAQSEPAPSTPLEAEQQRRIRALQQEVNSLKAQGPALSAPFGQSREEQQETQRKLALLIATAKQSGKVLPLSL
jgi:beta-lactamase regulating signal transducer with metallopeptidase domain